MADDLIVKFFREDLTEAEEAALSERLLSSTEDALRFGQHAEAAYHYYGLPEPGEPGKGPAGGTGPWKKRLLVAFLGIAGLAAWAWRHWSTVELHGKVLEPSRTEPRASVSTLPAEDPDARADGLLKIPRTPPAPPAPAAERGERVVPTLPTTPPGGIPAAPVNLQTRPHDPHSNLEVVVKRHAPGPVTVCVLRPDGAPAVLLYEGLLAAGIWAFDWNGRLADGSLPAPGTYQIQVESGGVTLRKSVVLREK